jgi:phage gpG-like protein
MKVNVQAVGMESAIKKLESLGDLEKSLAPIMRSTASAMTTFARRRIKEGVDADGLRYAPLSDEYRDQKKDRHGGTLSPVLIDRGDMVRGMFARAVKCGTDFGSTVNYLQYHQYGTKNPDGTTKMRRRSMYPITETNEISWAGPSGRFWQTFIDKILALVK